MRTLANHNPSSARLGVRLSPEHKATVARAAAALGQTLSAYSVSRLLEAARHDLAEQEATVLSDRDRDLFMAMLDSGAKPNVAMRRAAARYKDIRA